MTALVPSRPLPYPMVAIFAAAFTLLSLSGCGADGDAPAATPKASATGLFNTSIDGAAVSFDYAGGKANVALVHKINEDKKGYGCVTSAEITLEKADGSCALELLFQPSGTGLSLTSATFYASKATIKQGDVVLKAIPCAGFPGGSKSAEVVWTLAGGSSNISIDPMPPGQANKTNAVLKGQDLKLSGVIKLKKGGKVMPLDLSRFEIKGDFGSKGSNSVSCGVATGGNQCPSGVTYGNTVGTYIPRKLGAFRCDDNSAYDAGDLCGKSAQIVVAYQHWVTEKADWGGKDVLDGLYKAIAKHKDLGVVFVVLAGKQRVVVKDDKGEFQASGPAPTPADCTTIRKLYNLPASVIMVYDKDKALTSNEKQPVGVGFTPAFAFANSAGKIISVLPDKDGKMDAAALDKAIQAAVDAN